MNERNELTSAEEQKLSSLIKASYPSPSGNMADRVGEKITAIRASRRKRASLITRYGSIAACVVLIAGIALAVVPKIAKNDAEIMYDSVAHQETMMAYDMAASKECEEYANGTIENPASDSAEADSPEEVAEFSFDTLFCYTGLDPATCPTSNGSQFTEECDDNKVVEAPDLSFAGRNENSVRKADDAVASESVSVLLDIDGDGESEYCTVTSVTEPVFALHITASSVGGEIMYEAEFTVAPCSFGFEKADGQMLLRIKDSATDAVTYYAITVDGNELVLKQIEQ